MAGSRDRWSRLLWWSGLSKLFRNGRMGSSSLGPGCVSVLSVSRVLHGISDCSAHLPSHSAASTTCPISEHQQMLTFYTLNREIPVLFCFVLFCNHRWPERMLCCAFGKCINLHYQEPRKIRSLIPNQNPLTNKADRLVPCLRYASGCSALEYNGCFLRFLPQTRRKSMQRSPNITHD